MTTYVQRLSRQFPAGSVVKILTAETEVEPEAALVLGWGEDYVELLAGHEEEEEDDYPALMVVRTSIIQTMMSEEEYAGRTHWDISQGTFGEFWDGARYETQAQGWILRRDHEEGHVRTFVPLSDLDAGCSGSILYKDGGERLWLYGPLDPVHG